MLPATLLDPIARLGMSVERLASEYAEEIALCVKFNGDTDREIAEHESTAGD